MITTTSSVIDFEKAERDFLFLLLCFQEVLHDLGEIGRASCRERVYVLV